MQKCTKCGQQHPKSYFFVRNEATGTLHTQCKSRYQKQRSLTYAEYYQMHKDRYRQRAKVQKERLRMQFRQNMLVYLTDKECVLCKESDIRVLEFDHIDPRTKDFEISQSVKLGHSWQETLEEIKK